MLPSDDPTMLLVLAACVASSSDTRFRGGTEDAVAPDPWAPLVSEAVLHYGFEALAGPDGVVDDSPSRLDGIAYAEDDLAARIVPGPRGDALTFDGVRDFVYTPDADPLDLGGPLTLLAWIQATPRVEGAHAWPILDKYAYVAGAWTGYAAYLDGGQPYAGVYAGVETATECGGPSLGVFDDGAWHLYAAMFDGASLVVTVDASVAATCAWSLPPAANADFLEVGTRGGEYFFQGALDEVTLVPRSLTTEELTELLSVAN